MGAQGKSYTVCKFLRLGVKNIDHGFLSSCLAHVINLATQAVISTYSKAKYFDPEKPLAHEPDTDDVSLVERDVVGLVCAITVKVCTST